jgi:hypothetical protein
MTAKRVRLSPKGPILQVVQETTTSYLVQTYSGPGIWVRKDTVEVVA